MAYRRRRPRRRSKHGILRRFERSLNKTAKRRFGLSFRQARRARRPLRWGRRKRWSAGRRKTWGKSWGRRKSWGRARRKSWGRGRRKSWGRGRRKSWGKRRRASKRSGRGYYSKRKKGYYKWGRRAPKYGKVPAGFRRGKAYLSKDGSGGLVRTTRLYKTR